MGNVWAEIRAAIGRLNFLWLKMENLEQQLRELQQQVRDLGGR
jgi:hypothetical protein